MAQLPHTSESGPPRSTKQLEHWHTSSPAVEALEPSLPIVDAHHHLFGTVADDPHYTLDELRQDITGGHQIIATVYVEAYEPGWRTTGPVPLRPVGEVETLVEVARSPVPTPTGSCHVGAGIVAHVDLTLGDGVAEVLEAHRTAGKGRLRGVRHCTATDDSVVGAFKKEQRRPPHLLLDPALRRGFAHLERHSLVFDAWVYHTQLGELIDLADRFPYTSIVLDHLGAPLGIGDWSAKRDEVRSNWQKNLAVVASRPNVRVKIGGMGMIIFGFGFEHGQRPATSTALATAWQPYIDICLETFGSTRCMFESNFPEDKQSCSYVELWNAFKLATRALSAAERNDLFYRTACQTYALPEIERLGDSIISQ